MKTLPRVKGEYKIGYSLSHLTWFKVGGPAEVFFKPYDTKDLADFLVQNQGKLPVTIIGAGSNIIIRDGGIEGVVVKLGQNFTNIELDINKLSVGAGCLNFNLAKFCQANSITGFEFLVGIPGSIGGGVIMNAGAYGSEFKDIILAIEAVDTKGNIIILSPEEIGFKYRGNSLPAGLIITKAIFKVTSGIKDSITALMNEINAKRSATQPIKERTGGSTFANPYLIPAPNVIPAHAGIHDSKWIPDQVGDDNKGRSSQTYKAWQLIDKAGLRGYKVGDASMSTLHCNFMINHGNALAKDLEELGEFIRKKVFEDSKILLKWEIKIIGKHA